MNSMVLAFRLFCLVLVVSSSCRGQEQVLPTARGAIDNGLFNAPMPEEAFEAVWTAVLRLQFDLHDLRTNVELLKHEADSEIRETLAANDTYVAYRLKDAFEQPAELLVNFLVQLAALEEKATFLKR